MTNLLERLRAETRPQHDRMEAIFALPADVAAHRRWTATFYGFVAPLEQKLTALLGHAEHRFLAGRGKTAWLHDDLRALGRSEAEIAALPRCRSLPALETPEQALGALYVFEGSTLGGQLISKHLETVVGLKDGHGYRYFRSYGSEVGKRWQEFRALLLGNSGAGADEAIVAAANDTFARLQTWCETAHETN